MMTALIKMKWHTLPKRKDTEVEEVVSKIGLVHPITHDGYDICERAKLDALSNLTAPKLEPSE